MILTQKRHCSHFSSDFKHGCLIFSELDGSITYNLTSTFKEDTSKKFIRFYPPDTHVFTTTGTQGLKVWEREKEKVIYSYGKENLGMHSYSSNCIISTFDELSLRLFDLRTRYIINSCPLSGIEKVEWLGDRIFCKKDDSLIIKDTKALVHDVLEIENVLDFCICENKCYYLSSSNKKMVNNLTAMTMNDFGKVETLKKEVKYKDIQTAYNRTKLVGFLDSGVQIEDSEGSNFIKLEFEPKAIHLSNQMGFIFSDTDVYELRGELEL